MAAAVFLTHPQTRKGGEEEAKANLWKSLS